jgi:hypothetical protein
MQMPLINANIILAFIRGLATNSRHSHQNLKVSDLRVVFFFEVVDQFFLQGIDFGGF